MQHPFSTRFVALQTYSACSSASAASVPYLQPRLRNPRNFVLGIYKNIPDDFTQGSVYMIPEWVSFQSDVRTAFAEDSENVTQKEKESRCLVSTSSIKREIRHFQVVVKEMNNKAWCTCKVVVCSSKPIAFCRSRCRRRRRFLSSFLFIERLRLRRSRSTRMVLAPD